MCVEIRLALCLIAVVIATRVALTRSEIFTSSLKMERMVKEEENLLEELKHYIDVQYDLLKSISNFYFDRLRDARLHLKSNVDFSHPNSVYKTIQQFASDYAGALGDNFEMFVDRLSKSGHKFLANNEDVLGSRLSLVRLQSVYNLNVMDMIRGDYLGYQGPELEAVDAYNIGQAAFSDSRFNESLEWLNASLLLYSNEKPPRDPETRPSIGGIKALIGRVHLYKGNVELAKTFYNEAKQLDPIAADLVELREELTSMPVVEPVSAGSEKEQNFSRLCSLENRYRQEPNNRLIACRYKVALLPYYRFKEEILSLVPFVSIVYNFTSDRESDYMKDAVKNKLYRGRIGNGEISEIRTSDLGWIFDAESPVTDSLTKRIECVTGLYASRTLPDKVLSSEPFQVVNYGIGGHYDLHLDPHGEGTEDDGKEYQVNYSEHRFATFLMYLNDVEKGGSTVFSHVGMSVAPVKNMALFWYNYDPAYKRDQLTYHGGCPVLIGEKWIANKWILTHGNTFRRRCGLRADATHLDIEPDMRIQIEHYRFVGSQN